MVIIGNGMAGAWALAAHRVRSMRTRALWWFTVLVELAIFAQVIMGVILVKAQHRHVVQFHMLYGFAAIVAVAIIYSYAKQQRHRLYLLYGFGGLFIMGLGIRAVLVAKT